MLISGLPKRYLFLLVTFFVLIIALVTISVVIFIGEKRKVFEEPPIVVKGCWDNASRCEWINNRRVDHNLSRLNQREHLQTVAQLWAEHMKNEQLLHHNPSFFSTLKLGESGGENVGYGPDWRTVFRAFMQSPGHRVNMLDPDWTHVGIGTVRSGTQVWVVVVFHG